MIAWLIKQKNERTVNEILDRARDLRNDLEDRLRHPIYSTIKPFRAPSEVSQLISWIKGTINSDEYKFVIFQLRENTIAEMVGVTEADKIRELNARLNMLAIIDKYLHIEVEKYEAKIRRPEEDSKG